MKAAADLSKVMVTVCSGMKCSLWFTGQSSVFDEFISLGSQLGIPG